MGNRAWLYLRSEPHDGAPPIEVASANGNLPTLWQVLLTDGRAASIDDGQDLLGNGAGTAVSSDARRAHERLTALAAFLRSHASDDDAPHCLQFDAAVRYLAASIDAHDETTPLSFSANLNELGWLYDGDADTYVQQVRAACADRWAQLERAMQADDADAVYRLLEVADADDDSGWAWRVGFGGLSHPYFHEQEPARAVSFDDFNADDDQDEEAWLGGDLYRYRVGTRWGLRRIDVDTESEDEIWHVIAEPQWDAIWPSGASDERVVWMSRGGRAGLLGVQDGIARELTPPRYEAVWDFAEDVASVELDGRIGLLAADGRELMAPSLDEAWNCAEGFVVARVGELLGYVDKTGGWAIPPRFEDAGAFLPGGLAPAFEGSHWGLIDQNGAWVVAPTWDDIEWEEDLHAYLTHRDASCGLIDAGGRTVLDAHYAAMAPLDTSTAPSELWASGLMRIIVTTADALCGVVDGSGTVVVPTAYADVGEVSWLPSARPGIPEPAPTGQAGRYVRVLAHVDDDGQACTEGVYDTATGAEILPCRHVLTFGLEWEEDYGWLALLAPASPCPHSVDGLLVGLARADGTWLHAPVYAWIGSRESLQTAAGIYNGPPAIVRQWDDGLPVRAVRGDTGAEVLLHRDGRETTA